MAFLEDVHDQPEVLRRLVAAYRGEEAGTLARAVERLAATGSAPVLVIGMGSSLSAGRAFAGATERTVVLARWGSYHGNTLGALDLSGRDPIDRDPCTPCLLDHVSHARTRRL